MASLARTIAVHDDAILEHVERLPALADLVVEGALDAIRVPFELECRFLTEEFIPHLRVVEAIVYPELDRLMSCCHSMRGMRNEHRELEELVASLAGYRSELAAGRLDQDRHPALRHALFRLRSIVKVHLAEEARLIRVLEHNVSVEQTAALAVSVDAAADRAP
jgi:hypothetical protein